MYVYSEFFSQEILNSCMYCNGIIFTKYYHLITKQRYGFHRGLDWEPSICDKFLVAHVINLAINCNLTKMTSGYNHVITAASPFPNIQLNFFMTYYIPENMDTVLMCFPLLL